jgi:prevent-host-death family protein
LTFGLKVVIFLVMQAPIADVKKQLCELVDRVEGGETVIILRHGRPAARLMPMPGRGKPWRVDRPDDPAAYQGINIDDPVLEEI